VEGGEDGLPDGWLRYIIPSEDTNRSRWPVHPDWEVIQGAFDEEKQEDIECTQVMYKEKLICGDEETQLYMTTEKSIKTSVIEGKDSIGRLIRERKREVNLRRLIAQIAGCAITVEAWRKKSDDVEADTSDTFQFIYNAVEEYLAKRQRDYGALVRKKRVLYDLAIA
jgi:hypothetical protein